LPKLDNATTIDIGGGSTELAKIEDGKIVETISLNIGTVRLKELFYDSSKAYEEISLYIDKVLEELPTRFKSRHIIGIGGTIRAVSDAIRKDSNYPLESLHGYSYEFEENREFIKEVSQSEVLKLKKTSISKSRYDTIREGCAIFYATCIKLEAKEVITSKVGVREGVYLSDILRGNNHQFPKNFNISIKSLIDRFSIYDKHISYMQKTANKIYEKTYHIFDPEQVYKETFLKASKLLLITRRLNIYSNSDMSFSFLIENLNFALTHQEKVLIAFILKFSHKKEVDTKAIKKFQTLLPDTKTVEWLNFLLALSVCINKNKKAQNIEVEFIDKLLTIKSNSKMFLVHECIKKLKKPEVFAIQVVQST
jgi:exopolyphosphatase/guanosine-5'-triphosphate,3'-diphosphate pyrophosphatase